MENSDSLAKIVAVYGSVVDVQFATGAVLPAIGTMLKVSNNQSKDLGLQVVEHRGGNTCRCVALGFTYGVGRNMPVSVQEQGVVVPADISQLYGRVLNALANPIDHKGELDLKDAVSIKSATLNLRAEVNLEELV